MSHSALPLPNTVTLPAAFSLSLICTLLRALPPPDPFQPAAEADRLRKTLLLVQELAPRTVLEGMLVQQIVLGMAHGPYCAMQATLAAKAGKPAQMAQWERLVLAHGRLIGTLMRQRAAMRAAGGADAAEPEQTWDLAELGAMWRRWHAPPEAAELAADEANAAPDAVPMHPPINQAAELAQAAAAWPLSRQQRRALERMQRRMAARVEAPERAAA
jgi:hypothetical protein